MSGRGETGHAKHSFFAQGYVGMQIPASYADGVSADEGREIDIDTVCKFFPGIRNVQIPYVCMIRKAVIDNNRPVTPLRILTPEYRQFVKDNSAFIPSVIASGRDAFYAMPASLRLNELQLLVHVVASTFDRYINKGGIAIDVCRQTSISDTMIATLKKAYDKYAGFSHYRQVYHIAQSYCKTPLVNEIFKKLQNVPVS